LADFSLVYKQNKDQFPSNHGWMYDRCHIRRGALKESLVLGVEEFISNASKQDCYHIDGGVWCLCSKCDCTRISEERIVKVHLYKHGFKPNIGFGQIMVNKY